MVQRMFNQIWRLVEDDGAFVCVLIDEVESLAAARKAALSGSEPSDSIRVVNALLTQIDRLRKQKNVLILSTTNITEAIDIAFIDRADIKMYIGPPTQAVIYSILNSTLEELQRVGIIEPKTSLMSWATFQRQESSQMQDSHLSQRLRIAHSLYEIASVGQGLSGRAIRKLPFLAHAGYIQSDTVSLETFLEALYLAIKDEKASVLRLDAIHNGI
ncbi:Pachytene checkpoint protein 2 [Lobosporangium transversale]|nr:Pachytene checkpoint protein 2 [Lobosporangium transversale]